MNILYPYLPVPDHSEQWNRLDSTKLSCYSACPRRYFYSYVLGWKPDEHYNDLAFGKAWHAGLEHLYRNALNPSCLPEVFDIFIEEYRKDFPESTDSLFKSKNPERALLAYVAYVNNYPEDAYDLTILDTEVTGVIPLEHQGRNIIVKMDLVARDNRTDNIIVLEHKTGGRYSNLWELSWNVAIQPGAYLHALNYYYYDANKYSGSQVVINGTFFGSKAIDFHRKRCRKSNASMGAWLYTVNSLIDRIEKDFETLSTLYRDDLYLTAFPMNPEACTNYRGCAFNDLCTCAANPLSFCETPPDGFSYHWWNPLEEGKVLVKTRS